MTANYATQMDSRPKVFKIRETNTGKNTFLHKKPRIYIFNSITY
jgi:hypothetical protein